MFKSDLVTRRRLYVSTKKGWQRTAEFHGLHEALLESQGASAFGVGGWQKPSAKVSQLEHTPQNSVQRATCWWGKRVHRPCLTSRPVMSLKNQNG